MLVVKTSLIFLNFKCDNGEIIGQYQYSPNDFIPTINIGDGIEIGNVLYTVESKYFEIKESFHYITYCIK